MLTVMNEESKKNIFTTSNITSVTATIVAVTAIATLAHIAGEIRTGHKYLSQRVDEWDSQVITINDKIAEIRYGK